MSTRLYFATDRAAVVEPIEELSRVRLLRDLESDNGRTVPGGSTGTVVSVYGCGAAYYVELVKPFHALVTAESKDVVAILGEERDSLTAAAGKLGDRYR